MSNSIDGFRIYKKTELGEEFETTLPPSDRAYDILRTMEPGEYGISAYKNTGAFSYTESGVKYFKVKPFYKVICESSTTTETEVTVYWSTETNLNHINGYYIYRLTLQDGNRVYTEVARIDKELTSYTFTRDEHVVYTYVISPVTYEGFHDADSDEIRVLNIEIPPTTNIPAQTIRFRFEESDYNPTGINNGGTWTKVTDSSFNDWDWYCADTDWESKFDYDNGWAFTEDNRTSIVAIGDMTNVTSVVYMFYRCVGLTSIGNNTFNNVTNAEAMFAECTGLTSIPADSFNSVTSADGMFAGCTGLTSIPENSFNSVTSTRAMFEGCYNVQSGAFALYNKWNAGGKVMEHDGTFENCGANTETGLAELQQIPENWGGLKGKEPVIELPPQTIRFRFENADYDPTVIDNDGTWTKVSSSSFNDWDWYCAATDWSFKFFGEIGDDNTSIVATGDMGNVTSVEYMFCECTGLTSIPENSFNYVTNAREMFNGCIGLTSIGNNTFNNVTNAYGMFAGCTGLTSIPENSFYNVLNADSMFISCTGVTNIPAGSFNNVLNANQMFYQCTGLTSIGNYSFNSVTNANGMFRGCTGLTSIPENSFNSVTGAAYMFGGCTGLTSIPEHSFNSVTNADGMFAECTGLTSIPADSFNNVTVAPSMFAGCTGLVSIPENSFNNVNIAEVMYQMCTGLTSIPENSFNNVTIANSMFNGCVNVEHGALDLYNNLKAGGNVIEHTATFRECGQNTVTGLADLQQIPEDWGGLKVELPPNTFRFQWEKSIDNPKSDGRITLTQVDERTWDYTVAKDEYLNTQGLFASTFNDLTNKVKLIAVSDINGMTDMTALFISCTSLTTVPLFNTSSVTNMGSMFRNCTSLTTVPLFNTSSVTNMGNMFRDCTNIQSGALALYQQASSTGNVTDYDDTFTNCGINTETGLAELQQIPEDWGGLKVEEPVIELPPQTIRFRFENTDYDPTVIDNGGTWTKVSGSSFNDWDWYCADTVWESKFDYDNGLAFTEDNRTSIVATGDMTNVTSVEYMFYGCTGLTSIGNNSFNDVTVANGMFYSCIGLMSIPENSFNNVIGAKFMFGECTGLINIDNNTFDNVTDAWGMFGGCTGLTSIPADSFNNVIVTREMFNGCVNVEHGALDLYNNLKAGGNDVRDHIATFRECGQNTATGLAELQQIPKDWGGLKE